MIKMAIQLPAFSLPSFPSLVKGLPEILLYGGYNTSICLNSFLCDYFTFLAIYRPLMVKSYKILLQRW